VLPGRGGGDGGLFAGIAVRFIADAATAFADAAAAGTAPAAAREAAASARRLVTSNAEAVWATRATALGAPLFSADARRSADPAPGAPERDLSVQLGAWLTLEAAAGLAQ
jgi:predicted alpha-1,6-mannanase (GH76 family)